MNTIKVRNIEIGSGTPKIIVPIVGVTKQEIIDEAKTFDSIPVDVVEWRVDWFEGVFDFEKVEDVLKELRAVLGETPILMTFNQKDLGARISCSSLSLKSRNAQITLGCIVFSLFVWLLFILTALFIYGPDTLFSINGLHSLLNSAMILLFSIALTLLVSTFALKQQSLSMIANVASLGLCFLSGIFVPQYLLGKGVLAVAHFLPTYWYIRLNSMLGGISDEILTTAKYWRFIGIQFGFFVAIFCIYLVSSKYQKRSRNA